MPPMIGAAIGFMMSEPTPVPHMIGTSQAITPATVISFGPSRSTELSIVAFQTSRSVRGSPRERRSEGSGCDQQCRCRRVAASEEQHHRLLILRADEQPALVLRTSFGFTCPVVYSKLGRVATLRFPA
jgi:hypothetical protein